jgi:hypothetical protein
LPRAWSDDQRMTDRPAGTPEPDPADADGLEPAETIEAEAADGPEFDAEPLESEDDAIDDDLEADADDDELDTGPDDYDEAVREVAGEPVATSATAAGAAAVASRAKRRAQPPPTRGPSPSEIAVHVREDVSKVFVIAVVAVFVAILLNALLAGNGGLLTATPSPTASPSESASPSGSASASPSVSGSAPASERPSASAAASASASVSVAPSVAAPSVSPSP